MQSRFIVERRLPIISYSISARGSVFDNKYDTMNAMVNCRDLCVSFLQSRLTISYSFSARGSVSVYKSNTMNAIQKVNCRFCAAFLQSRLTISYLLSARGSVSVYKSNTMNTIVYYAGDCGRFYSRENRGDGDGGGALWGPCTSTRCLRWATSIPSSSSRSLLRGWVALRRRPTPSGVVGGVLGGVVAVASDFFFLHCWAFF
eukprot:COSAG02_NODE_830_length_16689_cov_10.438999_5_plen_202_part_00